MKIYALSGAPSGGSSYRRTWVYRDFFHGTHKPVANVFGMVPYKPLPLRRNVRIMPPVFFSVNSLVAENSVAERLAHFPGVSLNPCIWDKVYDWPVDEKSIADQMNRFSILGEEFSDWQEEQWKSPPRDWRGPDYFEIVTTRYDIACREMRGGVIVDLPKAVPFMREAPLITNIELHTRHPILKKNPYVLCVEEAFEVLRPHVSERELFTIVPFDLQE